MELICPACNTTLEQAGYTYRCTSCNGAWVHEDALVGMLEERASSLIELAWKPRPDDKPRNCAACGTPMQTVNLGTVALDRCEAHGVWFDPNELVALLEQYKQFKTHPSRPADHHGLLERFAKLFGG